MEIIITRGDKMNTRDVMYNCLETLSLSALGLLDGFASCSVPFKNCVLKKMKVAERSEYNAVVVTYIC